MNKLLRCLSEYCRFGNFRENFIFANCIKRHISDVKNSQLRQDIPISINDRVILPICEGFIFTAKFRENKVLAKISEFTVTTEKRLQNTVIGCICVFFMHMGGTDTEILF